MIVGWSIADHMRAELVVDALQMACWRRRPPPGTICHSDRGAQYTSWVFGHRLRQAGLLGSMGRVASSVDNTMIESFSTMQRELLDTARWETKHLLTQAAGLALIATGDTFTSWLTASALLGAGTAMVYPTLLAAVGDVAYPLWRARAVGVYRLWRDSGYAAGAVVGGLTADLWGLRAAIWTAAAITVASGLAVAVRMYETHPASARFDIGK
jgi:transposase InsO family protein